MNEVTKRVIAAVIKGISKFKTLLPNKLLEACGTTLLKGDEEDMSYVTDETWRHVLVV
jgi:hypothetical protein